MSFVFFFRASLHLSGERNVWDSADTGALQSIHSMNVLHSVFDWHLDFYLIAAAYTYFFEKSLKQSRNLVWCLVADFLPSKRSLRKTLATSMGPWLTVVPIQPCKTICKILGSGGTWFMAASSSAIFFWTSSIATSMGVKTICEKRPNTIYEKLPNKVKGFFVITCLRSTTWMRVLT